MNRMQLGNNSRPSKNWFRDRDEARRLSPVSPAKIKSKELLMESFFLMG